MGIGGIGIGPLLVILAIVILLFGTKKLRGMGSDLGGALKGFKKALNEEEKTSDTANNLEQKDTDPK
ncbi:MAG: twin-arginine translocase TatA/TatE family subunit [Cellvibrionaceae bacterium]|nr:twin-arginine translocase TatA/TatE family subunit [Cellvibrionaceae bacterium]